jgi:hypothetical protein
VTGSSRSTVAEVAAASSWDGQELRYQLRTDACSVELSEL